LQGSNAGICEGRQRPPLYAGLPFDDLRDIMSAEALYVVLDAGKPLKRGTSFAGKSLN
jgi:hypothetical protein